MENEFKTGDWVEVISDGCRPFFGKGDVGELLMFHLDLDFWFVRFEPSQTVSNTGNCTYGIITGKDFERVWGVTAKQFVLLNRPASEAEVQDGEWQPDELAAGIDVLRVTEELVSVEVGK